jgi:hypothetical protein
MSIFMVNVFKAEKGQRTESFAYKRRKQKAWKRGSAVKRFQTLKQDMNQAFQGKVAE